jgi:hypothetical protein
MVHHTTGKWFLMFFIRHLDSTGNANTILQNIGSNLTVNTAEHPRKGVPYALIMTNIWNTSCVTAQKNAAQVQSNHLLWSSQQ